MNFPGLRNYYVIKIKFFSFISPIVIQILTKTSIFKFIAIPNPAV